MYGVATYSMIAVTGLDGLDLLPKLALAVALVAWTAAFVGLVATLVAGAECRQRSSNSRWWLRSPLRSTNISRVSKHHSPSTRWKVSW